MGIDLTQFDVGYGKKNAIKSAPGYIPGTPTPIYPKNINPLASVTGPDSTSEIPKSSNTPLVSIMEPNPPSTITKGASTATYIPGVSSIASAPAASPASPQVSSPDVAATASDKYFAPEAFGQNWSKFGLSPNTAPTMTSDWQKVANAQGLGSSGYNFGDEIKKSWEGGVGGTPWEKMMRDQQNLEERGAFNNLTSQNAGAVAQARTNMAMKGGLRGGAAARMAMQGARDLGSQRQNLSFQGMGARANIGVQGEDKRMSGLSASTAYETAKQNAAAERSRQEGSAFGRDQSSALTTQALNQNLGLAKANNAWLQAQAEANAKNQDLDRNWNQQGLDKIATTMQQNPVTPAPNNEDRPWWQQGLDPFSVFGA
jgi:hypothetical protein